MLSDKLVRRLFFTHGPRAWHQSAVLDLGARGRPATRRHPQGRARRCSKPGSRAV